MGPGRDALHAVCPPERSDRLGLFMDYSKNFDDDEVPDPYYGLGQGFDLVLDMVEDATDGLVELLWEHSAATFETRKKPIRNHAADNK